MFRVNEKHKRVYYIQKWRIMFQITDWGDFATWVTGIGTISLFLITFISFKNEKDYRKNKELTEQAEKISCWISGSSIHDDEEYLEIQVLNSSTQPVYFIIITVGMSAYTGNASFHELNSNNSILVGIMPPGRIKREVTSPGRGMSHQPIIQYAFTDAHNKHWMRGFSGKLVGMKKPSYEYFNLPLPLPWNNDL